MQIPVTQLLDTNIHYNPDQLCLYKDLYKGGMHFEKHKDKYLRRRAIENGGSRGGASIRTSRLQCANYTPHSAGIINWLASAVLASPPIVIATIPKDTILPQKDATDKRLEYWVKLNDTIATVARKVLIEAMVQKRAYLAVAFPDKVEGIVENSIKDQKDNGTTDAEIISLEATDVDDWDEDSEPFYRTHTVEYIRATPYAQPSIERHYWTYWFTDRTEQYVADRKILSTPNCEYKCEEWTAKDFAKQTITPHDLGGLPIVPVQGPVHIMGNLSTTALALFNRECSLTYSLDMSAYVQPYILSDKQDLNGIVHAETAIMLLGQNDKVGFTCPTSDHFAALEANVEELKKDLFLSVQAMVLQGAQQTQNPRQSGTAKQLDYSSVKILLQGFADALRTALAETIKLIQTARGDEDIDICIGGLDQFATGTSEQELALAQSFLSISGIPEAAKKWAISQISQLMALNAPAEVRQQIAQELEDAEEIKEPEPKPEPRVNIIAGKTSKPLSVDSQVHAVVQEAVNKGHEIGVR